MNQCFTLSEFIDPVLPQAAQQGIHFIIFISQHIVRDAPPFEGPDLGQSTGEGK